MTETPVVILTAFDLEYQAVRDQLVGLHVHRHERGTRFELGRVRGTRCPVALAMTGKGNNATAVLAERALQHFSPLALLFVGVAGALWDTTRLGDVVVATHVYAYHGGTSEDDGMKARPRVWETAHEITQLAGHISRTGWTNAADRSSSPPRVHLGAIAAGEIVQNSRSSREAEWLRSHYNDALAIEMEGAGAAQAGHLNGAPIAVVRGISDRADGSKSSTEDRAWQPRAASNAASFAVRLAAELTMEREYAGMRNTNGPEAGNTVHNVAHGQVGIQGSHIYDSTVYMTTAALDQTPKGLAVELASFRSYLEAERARGALDESTFRAAAAELTIADTSLQSAEPEKKSHFVLALKRLRGLVSDITDLATKVTALIAAASGLS
ncbi:MULTISPECIES: 5'-methylthioadenosine/S-adenosylhomocysteine nucleosidase [Actinoalloteichus]|uniref:5'-methylthioadenosine/S-adenosylhomocysteine nucleosidase family protein n=1 Tax=Actinoalloteichus TaxID=65496 RepID=UPI00037EF2A7|nr:MULTISPECIES: 5'-methylthioadenosine/S-adenosylhomocysteine nucleosidase [Actinoalloteichus]